MKSATATAFGQINVRTLIEAKSIQLSLSDKFQRSLSTHWLGWRVLVATEHLFEYYAWLLLRSIWYQADFPRAKTRPPADTPLGNCLSQKDPGSKEIISSQQPFPHRRTSFFATSM